MSRIKSCYWPDGNTVVYQTNCLYTEEGQIVAMRFASDVDGPYAFFYDYCRGVYGRVDLAYDAFTYRDKALVEEIDSAYLHGYYEGAYDGQLIRVLQSIAHDNKHRVPCTRS